VRGGEDADDEQDLGDGDERAHASPHLVGAQQLHDEVHEHGAGDHEAGEIFAAHVRSARVATSASAAKKPSVNAIKARSATVLPSTSRRPVGTGRHPRTAGTAQVYVPQEPWTTVLTLP